jgi:hypothetical protein
MLAGAELTNHGGDQEVHFLGLSGYSCTLLSQIQVSGRTWNTQMIPLAMADAEQIKVFPLSAGSK